jgi:hypothetical protein
MNWRAYIVAPAFAVFIAVIVHSAMKFGSIYNFIYVYTSYTYTKYNTILNIVHEFGVPTYLLPSIFQGAAYHHQQHDRQMAAALRTARLASGGVVKATFPLLSIISTFSHFRGLNEMY